MITEKEIHSQGFVWSADDRAFRRELENNISLVARDSPNGMLLQIQVLNEFEGPYYKDESISIDLTTEDLQDAIRLAGYIRRVTVESRII